mmetsp:Transcript_69363/g.195643  ORF Transcript_69363/g.195643 Transcript_69363/m.195643 type:complete len:221 (+) Transcript_69363:692-1354(+)
MRHGRRDAPVLPRARAVPGGRPLVPAGRLGRRSPRPLRRPVRGLLAVPGRGGLQRRGAPAVPHVLRGHLHQLGPAHPDHGKPGEHERRPTSGSEQRDRSGGPGQLPGWRHRWPPDRTRNGHANPSPEHRKWSMAHGDGLAGAGGNRHKRMDTGGSGASFCIRRYDGLIRIQPCSGMDGSLEESHRPKRVVPACLHVRGHLHECGNRPCTWDAALTCLLHD